MTLYARTTIRICLGHRMCICVRPAKLESLVFFRSSDHRLVEFRFIKEREKARCTTRARFYAELMIFAKSERGLPPSLDPAFAFPFFRVNVVNVGMTVIYRFGKGQTSVSKRVSGVDATDLLSTRQDTRVADSTNITVK